MFSFSLVWILCPGTDISVMVQLIVVRMIHIHTRYIHSLLCQCWQQIMREKNPKFWASIKASNSKTVSCSITYQLRLNISLMGAFQKCMAWDGSPPEEFPISKYMYFCIFFQQCAINSEALYFLTVQDRGILSVRQILLVKNLSNNYD